MSDPIYAEPIPQTFEDFFNNEKILEALKKFISENTTSEIYEDVMNPVDYINDFFLDKRRKLNTMTPQDQKSFYQNLAESLKHLKKKKKSKLDLLIGLLENKKPRNESNFTELFNMLQFDVYQMAKKGNQGNSVYAVFGNAIREPPKSPYTIQATYANATATQNEDYEVPVSVSPQEGFDYRNPKNSGPLGLPSDYRTIREYIPVASQPPVYGSINGENAVSVSPNVLAQEPEMVGHGIYTGFWGNNDLSLG